MTSWKMMLLDFALSRLTDWWHEKRAKEAKQADHVDKTPEKVL